MIYELREVFFCVREFLYENEFLMRKVQYMLGCPSEVWLNKIDTGTKFLTPDKT